MTPELPRGLRHEERYPTHLTDKQLRDFLASIEALYRWYSPGSDETRMRRRLTEHAETVVDLIMDGSRVVAFAVNIPLLCPNGASCLFRHGTIITETHRTRGLYRRLLGIALDRCQPQWAATRTQNPRVYETWAARFGTGLLPRSDRAPDPDEQAIARFVARDHPTFDPDTFIVQGAYTEDRTGAEYHRCRSPEIQQFFAGRLGPHDAMILLARVRSEDRPHDDA